LALTGGVADKFGNRYEGRWTVACMAGVLDDRWTSITLEPYDGFKIEFTGVCSDGSEQHHQAKRRAPGEGSWSLAALDREGLLAGMLRWTETGHQFHLVSGSPIGGGLLGLADMAQLAPSFDAFKGGLSDDRGSEFAALCGRLRDVTEERTWQALARTRFRQTDETTATELASRGLSYVVDGDPLPTTRLLADYALESVGQRLTATTLWRFLEASGRHRRAWGRDPAIRVLVESRRERFVRERESARIAGHLFDRAVAAEVAELLRAGTKRVVLSATAGMGKSIAVREAVELLAHDVLVLPFGLDHLPAAVEAQRLGESLGLPGSPALVLAHLSAGERAVLVIDQLDAVSQVSGRNPEALAAVDEMLRECDDHPNIGVLLVCRDFDLSADTRLQKLRNRPDTKVVELGPLSDAEVDVVLDAVGRGNQHLSERQRELVRVPLHLRLLAEAPTTSSFKTELDLFEAYWEAKRDAVVTRGGSDSGAVDVVARLASAMSDRQALIAPDLVIDRLRHEAGILQSEHVLVREGRSLRFFHEKFFDFAFARAFAETGDALVSFVLSTDQGLFRRSQVRQILAYRRLSDPEAYLRDLHDLLDEPAIRFHIKALVLSWLGTIDEPSLREWAILSGLIDSADETLGGHVVSLLRLAPKLFDRADEAGAISEWLTSDSEVVRDRAAWVLAQVQRQRPGRVAQLLAGLDLTEVKVRQRLAFVIRMADLTLDEAFFRFFCDLIARGCFDDLGTLFGSNGSFWNLGHPLADKRPAWGAWFVSSFLQRRIRLAELAGQANPFNDEWIPDMIDASMFTKIATAAPAEFTESVLPLILGIIRTTGSKNERNGSIDDPIWRYRLYGRSHGVEAGLIESLELALQRLATTDPIRFASARKQLEEANASTADHLLSRAFTAAPDGYAADVARWILANPSRLEAGYTDAPQWAGRELLAAIWPHLDTAQRQEIEAMLLAYYNTWERSVRGHHSHGYAQFVFLSGLPEGELTDRGRRRLAELRRKFGVVQEPHGIVGGFVGSPVPDEKIALMSDVQWFRAISRYSSDAMRHDRPFATGGGVYELAQRLQAATKSDPVRFARFAVTLPKDVHSAYPEALLRGVAEADGVPVDLVFELARWCHGLPGRPCGRYICDAIAAQTSLDDLPSDIIELISWYATSDPDPSPGSETSFGNQDHGARMGLLNAGINTDRGRAAEAIGKIVRANPESLDRWKPTLSQMVRDPSEAVRACVAEALLATLSLDRDWTAVAAGIMLGGSPEVASSVYGEQLIRLLTLTHPDVALPIIETLAGSENESVAHVGARLACLASFSAPAAEPMARSALSGNVGSRLGAAEVYSANIANEALRKECRSALMTLFADADEHVRREAGTAFQNLRDASLGSEQALIEAFANSPALADNPHDVVDALLESTAAPPDATLFVCRKVVEAAGDQAGSIASHWSAEMPDIAALAVRLASFGTPEAGQGALDVIDRLSALSAYGLDQAIQQFER
jgi:hypothetical protein